MELTRVNFADDLSIEFKRVQSILFPGLYDLFYYKRMHRASGYSAYLAMVNGTVVGCFSMELLTEPQSAAVKSLPIPGDYRDCVYIHSLGVLALHRRQGYGRRIFEAMTGRHREIRHFYLHVQTDNLPAIGFYQQLGFAIMSSVPQFYRSTHRDAYLMRSNGLERNDDGLY
jgi:ribosomal protein S18 acetylase RimI-like enzyme